MQKVKPIFSPFGKPGEEAYEKEGVYVLHGHGTDLGCNLVLQEEIKNPSILELEVKGEIKKEAPWSRLRIEVYDLDNSEVPATSFEDDYLTIELDAKNFRKLALPVLGIVKVPHKIQFMVVGPAKSTLEIKNVAIR